MKKYKLIKELPFENSPKIGYVSKGINKDDEIHYLSGLWFNPENYPEFWQEIVEYPIDTKVFNEQTKATYIKKEDGWYKISDKTTYTDEMITKSKYINIIEEKVV